MTPLITKASGQQELFSEAKLRRSLERTHAPKDLINEVVTTIQHKLYPGISTHEIYQMAFAALREIKHFSASRYHLKRALMELGPEGHLFEQLIGEIFKKEGFSTELTKVIPGFCVSHEIDVIAKKPNHQILVECKFHNSVGTKSDVKVTLYIQARFQDILKKWDHEPNHTEQFHEVWVVTNTALSTDAIQYAQCTGMKGLSWNYPPENSLATRIQTHKLYPITCLPSLTPHMKKRLLERGALLCRDLLNSKAHLHSLNLNALEISEIEAEILALEA